MKHILTGIFLLTLITSFGQTSLKITEYQPFPAHSTNLPNVGNAPWLELFNEGNHSVETGSYKIRVGGPDAGITTSLPAMNLLPGQSVVFLLKQGGHSGDEHFQSLPIQIHSGTESLVLLNAENMVEDSLSPANPVKEDEVWVRNAISGKWSIFPANFSSPGELNTISVNWNKIASTTNLPPADSEPNACLSYKGKIWILGGWTYQPAEQTFASSTYLWNSEDGVHWDKIADTLPFTHYSAFIVFHDTMWVYANYHIYCSVDGINWEIRGNVPYDFFGTTSRLTVMNNKIYFADTAVSGFSEDGIAFTFQKHNIPPRSFGALKAMGGKLYFMGGYDAANDKYLNDVWSSADGLNWTSLVQNAPWAGRRWFMSEVYQDKIWVFGGYNTPDYQSQIYANLNDIWYSEDGISWQSYTPLNPWPIRHGSYHTLNNNRIFLIGGFDNAEINGLLNDVWTFEITNYYLKPGADINNLKSWSSTSTLDGPAPVNFNQDLNIYHINLPGKISFDNPFLAKNTSSTLVIGDGTTETSLELLPQSDHRIKTVVSPVSMLTITNQQPLFTLVPQPGSHVLYKNCAKLRVPSLPYGDLSIENSRMISTDTLNVTGNFSYHLLSLGGTQNPEITINLKGDLVIGERSGIGRLRVIGISEGDQKIYTHQHKEQSSGSLILIKPHGNFILKDPLRVDTHITVTRDTD